MATGEVLLNGAQIGTAGSSGFPLSNLLDGSDSTWWTNYPSSTPPWAGIDAGVACSLTRIRISPIGGNEDYAINATLQGGSSSSFSSGVTVQQWDGNYPNISSQTSVAVNMASANLSGNSIVVGIIQFASGVTVTVNDTVGNTYVQVASPSGGLYNSIFVASNIGAASAGANTVTASFSPNASYPSIQVLEVSGLVSSSPLDVAGQFSGTSAAPAATLTTTNANDCIFMFAVGPNSDAFSASGGSILEGTLTSGGNLTTFIQQYSSAGSNTCAASLVTSGGWQTIAAALKMVGSPPLTLYTISARPVTGTLLNEYDVSPGQQFRYYRLSSPLYGDIADLDFIAQYTAGIAAAACAPTFAPFGGVYDYPIVVSLSSLTTDAAIYYTTNGTTPTSGSTPYTGPFVVSSSCIVQAIAISSNVSNSRVSSQQYSIGSQIISTNLLTDANRGAPMYFINPNVMWDPVSSQWFMYVMSTDNWQVYESFVSINIYQSADLRNWNYVGEAIAPTAGNAKGSTTFYDRPHCLYNQANNNYVLWSRDSASIFTASSPNGPFTYFGAIGPTVDGYTWGGDFKIWLDSDGITAWLFWTSSGNTTIGVSKLNSAFTATDGVNHVYYTNNGSNPFGQTSEGFAICKVGSVYFWMTSGSGDWQAVSNLVVSMTNPLGPYSAPFNPFQNIAVSQTPIEVSLGITPTYLNAYDSQCTGLFQIPGRNAVIYMGDRYSLPSSVTGQSTVYSLAANYRLLELPAIVSGTSMSITWNDAWTLDALFPPAAGLPKPPSNFYLGGSGFTWVNNEPGPVCAYLDSSPNSNFSTVTQSEVISLASPVPALYAARSAITLNTWYRIRVVNANGTSASPSFIAGRAPASGGPPAVLFSTGTGVGRVIP